MKDIIYPFIPLVAMVLGIGFAIFASWSENKRKREMFELHHKERLLAIERGMEVPPLPPEFFRHGFGRHGRDPSHSLRRGLVMLLIGVAVMISLGVNRGPEAATWGLIPFAVGLANVIYFYLATRSVPGNPGTRINPGNPPE